MMVITSCVGVWGGGGGGRLVELSLVRLSVLVWLLFLSVSIFIFGDYNAS